MRVGVSEFGANSHHDDAAADNYLHQSIIKKCNNVMCVYYMAHAAPSPVTTPSTDQA
jgi:hypothetical protein